MIAGLTVHVALVITIAVQAYTGVLWGYLPGIPHFDLAGHFVLIGGLAFFLDGALDYRPLTSRGPSWLRLAPTLILSLAAIEEWAQTFASTRSATFSDFFADVAGVISLSMLSRWLGGRSAAKNTR